MSFPFSANQGLVIVAARLMGPLGSCALQLALDTGALTTFVHPSILAAAGYHSTSTGQRTQVLTPAGIIVAPIVTIDRLTAIGKTRILLPVVSAPLDPSAGIDGLLGLDFLRGLSLTLDFGAGQMTLA